MAEQAGTAQRGEPSVFGRFNRIPTLFFIRPAWLTRDRSADKMKLLLLALIAFCGSPACAKKTPAPQITDKNEEAAFAVDPKFSDGASVMLAARKVFPESDQISLLDFWASADKTHEFVVFFAGREIKGGFEGMYWRYLAFAKKKADRDWSSARVFELPDNHPEPFSHSLDWLEKNVEELKTPNPESSVSRSRHMTPVEQAPGKE